MDSHFRIKALFPLLLSILAYSFSFGQSFGPVVVVDTENVVGPSFELVDLNNDGLDEILISRQFPNVIGFYENLGGGMFSDYTLLYDHGDAAMNSVFAVDLNGDQLPEIVFADQFEDDILVLQNQDNLDFSVPSFISGELDGGNTLRIVDLEGDNDLDIVALQSFDTNFSGGLRFYRNNGDGTFADVEYIGATFQGTPWLVVDNLDGDEFPDIWISENGGGQSAVCLSSNAYLIEDQAISFEGLQSPIALDVDQDDDLDIVYANQDSGNFDVSLNDGLGQFSAGSLLVNSSMLNPSTLVHVDFENGDEDSFICSDFQEVYYYENIGDGNYTETLITSEAGGWIDSSDLDNDGDIDVAGGSFDQVFLLFNCSDTFTSFEVTECDSYTLPSGNLSFNEAGTYFVSDTLSSVCGADSILNISVTILPELNSEITGTYCHNEEIEINGTIYNALNPSGIEVIEGVGEFGCDSIISVNINLLPENSTNFELSLCNDESIEINGTLYNASNLSGTEIFEGEGVFGCDSTVFVNLEHIQLDLSLSVLDNVLTSNEVDGMYQWIDCFDNAEIDGETSQSFSPSENGSYAVEISVDECIAFSECEEIIITSVEPTIEHLEIDLFPNPIINLLTVKFEHSNEISISIYNVYGKEVYQNVTFGGSSSISTITWSSGIYFVHVLDQSSSEVEIFKVIKK